MADTHERLRTLRFDIPSGTYQQSVLGKWVPPPFRLQVVSACFVPVVDIVSATGSGRTIIVANPLVVGTGDPLTHWTCSAQYTGGKTAKAFVANDLPLWNAYQAAKIYIPGVHVMIVGARNAGAGSDFPGGTIFVTVRRIPHPDNKA